MKSKCKKLQSTFFQNFLNFLIKHHEYLSKSKGETKMATNERKNEIKLFK